MFKTGEDVITFFARYGNTTPIKFVHCIRTQDMQVCFAYFPCLWFYCVLYWLSCVWRHEQARDALADVSPQSISLEAFRPYDLSVVSHKHQLIDYYTISASGVVHIQVCGSHLHTSSVVSLSYSLFNIFIVFQPDEPSEFISLSDWMRQVENCFYVILI